MSGRDGVNCVNCGYLVAASSIWAINGLCSECLRPLDTDPGDDVAVGDGRETVLRCWFDAFNARELDAMLACMHPGVDFHPLRLHGLASAYRGHDGVRRWFGDLETMQHRHRIELSEIRDGSDGQLVAIGSLSLVDPSGPSSFWGLERFSEGTIAAAHHYLTDPSIGFGDR